MAYNIKIPAVDEAFYTPTIAKQNEEKIKSVILTKYGSLIKNIASITNVPEQLITSLIFIESGGRADIQSPYATGLLQLSPATASDTLITEQGLGRLEAPEAAILKKYLGSRFSLIQNAKKGQKSIGKTFITNDDLKIPELNLLIGAIKIGLLLDEFSDGGTLRLDKVIILYNGGRNSAAGKKAIKFQGTTKELIKQVPKETADYIKKLIGVNSLLHSLV